VPITGKLIGATTPAPELQKAYYYNRYARPDSTGAPTAVTTTVPTTVVWLVVATATVATAVSLATTVVWLVVATATVATAVATTIVISNVVLVA
jgi:hypothetical protein